MIVILGLALLVIATVVAIAGALNNDGPSHSLGHEFSVLGYHITGSAGTLFLNGAVVGSAAMLGLVILLAGARRSARRGTAARRGLRVSRQQTAAATESRDDLIRQREDEGS